MTGPDPLDLTGEDDRVERTDNSLRPEDPPEADQPPQDPNWLPDGTETGQP